MRARLIATRGRTASLITAMHAHRFVISGAAILIIVGLTLLVALNPVHVRGFRDYGYLGVFVVTLLGTAAMVVPVPYIFAIAMSGSWGLDPVAVAVVAGVAAALGETTGYAAGLAGNVLLPDRRWVRWVETTMARFGALVVFLAAFVPNPFFDAVGVMAGATRLRFWLFCTSCFVGKTLRFWMIAAGSAAFLAAIGHPNLLGGVGAG